ncbi:uncharacterized protein LOC129596599 [Paramacrobiotus metropolitanus]|uniref:uncharacterized protein LOC129596599 n=1 Tax=Paramacrobiotus metropolitanus TaxID=2943436 RepID=UPI00244562B7|nr:uncharacterized protein LOC129596599 [Paramacrobiotus metropolitanus]
MPVYGDQNRRVCGWNTVDVLIDGHLQHGDVINLAQGGLIVDFRCATQRAQFVEYGRAFHCPFLAYQIRSSEPNKQVLLRRYPDGAWIWYSGHVVQGGFSCLDADMMEVDMPQGTVRQLVPGDQIRSEMELGGWRVGQDDFVIRSCPLPPAYWSGASQLCGQIFKYQLSQRFNVLCTSLLSQTLLYLQRNEDTPLTLEQVKGVFDTAKEEEHTGTSQYIQKIFRQRISTPKKGRKSSGDCRRCLPLPTELLLEIFRSLDSIGRIRCRRVCRVWNTLLTTEGYFPHICVSVGHPDDGVLTNAWVWHGFYWAASCLLQCLTNRTRMVIIRSADIERCRNLAGLINDILKPARLPTLVFYECEMGDEENYLDTAVDKLVSMFGECSACDRVLWKKCDIRDLYLKADVAQHSFFAHPKQELERELYEVFENNLILGKPLNRPALAASITDCIAHKSSELTEKQIVKALNEYQRWDPRLSTAYRGRKWTPAALGDLDASKLTTTTAVILSEGILMNDDDDTDG